MDTMGVFERAVAYSTAMSDQLRGSCHHAAIGCLGLCRYDRGFSYPSEINGSATSCPFTTTSVMR